MNSPFDLTGKTILITGASSGLGQQAAISSSMQGATLIITGRDKTRLDETLKRLKGDNHKAIIADLCYEEQINNLVDQLPKLNGVVYSVGISDLTPAQFLNSEIINKNYKINFEASVLLSTRILRKKRLLKGSSIVFISSISTVYPFAGGAMYISTKAALEAYSRVLALELAPKKIRSNCLRPAFVKTHMLDETAENYSKAVVDKIEEQQLLGLGEPEDVANAIVFFLSDASKWITATNLILGGG